MKNKKNILNQSLFTLCCVFTIYWAISKSFQFGHDQSSRSLAFSNKRHVQNSLKPTGINKNSSQGLIEIQEAFEKSVFRLKQ